MSSNQPPLISSCNIQSEDVTQDNNEAFTISPQVAEGFSSNEDVYHVTAQSRSPSQQAVVINTLEQINVNPQNQLQPAHPTVFFYRLPNEFCHYYVNCEEISYDAIESLLKKLFNDKESTTQFKDDEYIFIYQQKSNNRFYKVSCKIVSPHFVNYWLNKSILEYELEQQNTEQEHLSFTFDQKEYLEHHLKQHLSQHLLL